MPSSRKHRASLHHCAYLPMAPSFARSVPFCAISCSLPPQLHCLPSIDTAAAAAAATCNTRVLQAAQETGQTAAVDSGQHYARAAEHRELHSGSEYHTACGTSRCRRLHGSNKKQGAQLPFNFASIRFSRLFPCTPGATACSTARPTHLRAGGSAKPQASARP